MGKSSNTNKSHGKKTEKGTQSPVLKIFREIMQKEKCNPDNDKTKLIREKRKKRKHAESLDVKSEDSSSLEKMKRKLKQKIADRVTYQTSGVYKDDMPFAGDKRDSWWLFGEKNNATCSRKSTNSYVSCQLKKIFTNDYVCPYFLAFILIGILIMASVVAMKSLIIKPAYTPGAFRFMRTKTLEKTHPDYTKLDFGRNLRRSIPSEAAKNLEASPGYYDLNHEFDFTNMEDVGEPGLQSLSELSSILDPKWFNDERISPRMRHFYKKLLETEAQIQNLRKSSYDNMNRGIFSEPEALNPNSLYRLKRSLFHHKSHKTTTTSETPTTIAVTAVSKEAKEETKKKHKHEKHKKLEQKVNKVKRPKRFENETAPSDVIIEKKKLFIQYLDDKPNFPKCSHNKAGKNKPLNRKRLNDMLDIFLNKNDIRDDLFGNDNYLDQTVEYESDTPFQKLLDSINKYWQDKLTTNVKNMKSESSSDETGVQNQNNLKTNVYKAKKLREDLQSYLDPEVLPDSVPVTYYPKLQPTYALSISTLMIPTYDVPEDRVFQSDDTMASKFSSRKLMQMEEADEDQVDEIIAYEDFKEVLSDDMATHDENERQIDRKKRDEAEAASDMIKNLIQPATPKPRQVVYNPNWKEPLPSYPEEMNSITNHINPSQPNMKDTIQDEPIERMKRFFRTKSYGKTVGLAQAYSDYGVLSRGVPNMNKYKALNKADRKIEGKSEHKVKTKQAIPIASVDDWRGGFKYLTGTPSKFIAKHMKSYKTPNRQRNMSSEFSTTLLPVQKQVVFVYNANQDSLAIKNKCGKKVDANYGDETSIILHKPKTVIGENFDSQTDNDLDVDNLAGTNFTGQNNLFNIDVINDSQDDPSYNSQSIFENNVKNPLNRQKRSLKEFHETDLHKPNKVKHNSTMKPVLQNKTTEDENNNTSIEVLTRNSTKVKNMQARINETKQYMKPSDFILLLSDWFNQLASMSMDPSSVNVSRSVKLKRNVSDLNKTRDIEYPLYDSDMIDNIGHRSRVLLSVEEKADIDSSSELSNMEQKLLNTTKTSTSTKAYKDKNPNVPVEQISEIKDGENKTVVKRAVSDSDLVFWNDLYDDDYGTKSDPLNENTDIKKTEDMIKKSANWLEEKVWNVANTFKNKSKLSIEKIYKPFAREKRQENEEGQNPYDPNNVVGGEDIIDFAEMTASMKEVCRHAAKAVQDTNKIFEKDQETVAATGLMQNLVKLMSELVEYEVEQKSCLRLPEDLKDFLEWLTAPVPEDRMQRHLRERVPEDYSLPTTGPMFDLSTSQSSEQEEARTDSRSECLGTINAVRDLIEQYSQLSDEEKERVSDIKKYLEGQLQILTKQLNSLDDSYLSYVYSKNAMPFRFRRNSPLKYNNRIFLNPKSAREQKFKRHYLKNYYKKHTRTTANNFDSVQFATDELHANKDVNIRSKKSDANKRKDEIATKNPNKMNEDDLSMKVEVTNSYENQESRTTRNLKDVYYKAWSDAKKTTSKGNQVNEFDTYEKNSVRSVN